MKKRGSLFIFFAVIKALFLREIGMRISIGKSGLFWTFFEPFMQVFMFVALHSIISKSSSFSMELFMASGFIPFNMFKSILSSATGAFNANRGLFIYKQVRPIDTIIARAILELFFTSIIVVVFIVVGTLLGFKNTLPENIVMVFIGYLWLWLFAIGFGLIVGIGNTFFVSIGKFMAIISFALLIFSAVFYPLINLPPMAQDMILYNPLVHFMEMIHGFYMYELDDRFVDYRYMLLWTITVWFIGIKLYISLEKRIISI